jgi:hypothetical protein
LRHPQTLKTAAGTLTFAHDHCEFFLEQVAPSPSTGGKEVTQTVADSLVDALQGLGVGQLFGLIGDSLSDPSARNALGAYMQFARYPPDSRPLTSSSWDLLNPWSADAPSLPMIPQQVMTQVESLRASGMAEEEAWRNVTMPAALPRYQFETNKVILTGTRDELTATLTFTPDPSAGKPLQIHVTKAELIGDDDFGSPRLGSVPVSCRFGGSVCTFHWKAPAAQKEYWGVLTLMVTASVAGLADEFVIRQTFYSSPMVAGRFTGQFQERLENGSLVIDAKRSRFPLRRAEQRRAL